MYPRTLTDEQITDGELFIEQLTKAGITVDVAFWVRTTDGDSCYLYIALPIVDRDGLAAAYRTVFAELARNSPRSISRSDIRLVGSLNVTAQEALSYRNHHLPPKFGGRKLGELIIDEAYIYPA